MTIDPIDNVFCHVICKVWWMHYLSSIFWWEMGARSSISVENSEGETELSSIEAEMSCIWLFVIRLALSHVLPRGVEIKDVMQKDTWQTYIREGGFTRTLRLPFFILSRILFNTSQTDLQVSHISSHIVCNILFSISLTVSAILQADMWSSAQQSSSHTLISNEISMSKNKIESGFEVVNIGELWDYYRF